MCFNARSLCLSERMLSTEREKWAFQVWGNWIKPIANKIYKGCDLLWQEFHSRIACFVSLAQKLFLLFISRMGAKLFSWIRAGCILLTHMFRTKSIPLFSVQTRDSLWKALRVLSRVGINLWRQKGNHSAFFCSNDTHWNFWFDLNVCVGVGVRLFICTNQKDEQMQNLCAFWDELCERKPVQVPSRQAQCIRSPARPQSVLLFCFYFFIFFSAVLKPMLKRLQGMNSQNMESFSLGHERQSSDTFLLP